MDLYAIYRDMRQNSPVLEGNFMGRLGVPTIAGLDANRPTFTLLKYNEAVQDLEIRGVKIPKGAMVQCIVSSANRDEEAFENSETFDIDRKPKPSFGFGFGPHMCIGQFVAQTELQVAVNAVLDLLPNLSLDLTKPAPKITGAQLRGPHELHVI